jgi:ABC-type xylose transport system permease subunit
LRRRECFFVVLVRGGILGLIRLKRRYRLRRHILLRSSNGFCLLRRRVSGMLRLWFFWLLNSGRGLPFWLLRRGRVSGMLRLCRSFFF